jgi:hypothetical protein
MGSSRTKASGAAPVEVGWLSPEVYIERSRVLTFDVASLPLSTQRAIT